MSITPTDWGKDHWSLLGYLMTRAADHKVRDSGDIFSVDRRHMRCNTGKHPLLSGGDSLGSAHRWQDEYSTRLRGYWKDDGSKDTSRMVIGHDDWDVIDDLEAEGLVEILSLVNGYIRMTEKGAAIGADLMRHKARGGHFAGYNMPAAAS